MSPLNNPPDESQNNALELYKMEYERCAQRYDDIFKAVWTNFSYMAVLAGGLLTFGGSSHLKTEVMLSIACLPLIFWFWATFKPMNRYGDKVIERLSCIEKIINYKFPSLKLGGSSPPSDLEIHEGLHHFTEFCERKGEGKTRVRYTVTASAILIHGLAISSLLCVILGYSCFKRFQQDPTEDKITITVTKPLGIKPLEITTPVKPTSADKPAPSNTENNKSEDQ